ncbi:hypothetical protein K450DRAFT_232485 [Umbelopsis ramanniana AG]|uniref:DUF726-domain-containing protein n=1 Tax=Umbelopsis ramanniana AG TaxID=1314678 RepID=A0AAD5ED78_UMBRA|nr:uncharacterized protein K450DRAFT_232485 [Umbelopsis ramanniana AG]KAI8581319.1 hypothetical protein K450DRAFT_232485 [Umbelopsis ramanniana AG]
MQPDITSHPSNPALSTIHRENNTYSLSCLTSNGDEDEMDRANNKECNDTDENVLRGSMEDLHHFISDNVTPDFPEGDHGSTVTPLPEATHSLTTSSLATQNDLIPPSPTPISVWAADLPVVEQPQEAIPPSSPRFPHSPSHIFEISQESDFDDENDRRIQETKDVFTDTQKIAYVGLCSVTSLEVVHECQGKDFAYARMSAGNWQRKVIRSLYMHMDISSEEISMIESLAKHNILPTDLVHQFTSQGETTTVPVGPMHKVELDSNVKKDKPEIVIDDMTTVCGGDGDQEPEKSLSELENSVNLDDQPENTMSQTPEEHDGHGSDTDSVDAQVGENATDDADNDNTSVRSDRPASVSDASSRTVGLDHDDTIKTEDTTLDSKPTDPIVEEGKPQELVVDLRWTVVCDLVILCLSMNNYDARSRVFIRKIATYLSLEWPEVIAFERRISEYLAQNDPSWETESEMSFMTTGSDETTMTNATSEFAVSHKNDAMRKSRNKQQKKKRYIMMGLATLGGGLVLGLSAGLMAPVIAGGLGAVLTTVGVTGTSGFLGGTAGIALITSGATVAGGRIGAKRMFNRTKGVDTFEFVTVKAEDRVNCLITITGWLSRPDNKEEAAHPFCTIDSLMGDHYTLFWEPELLTELGSAIKIIATEVVTQAIQQALQHTIMGALLAGLTWPLALTKIGYLIDNPWANALDRARIAGLILADSLMNRSMGSRPVTLVGFSLGARVVFFCLLELARMHAFGLVEDVAIFGTPVSASMSQWKECTTVVAGRFVNGYATNDWLLGFLFRASTGGLGSVAGLRPLKNVEQNVQNLDCTDLVKGHLHYRTAMPKLLKRAGFEVTSEELPELKEKERPGGVMGLVGFGRSSLAVNENDSKERASSSGSRSSTPSIDNDSTSKLATEIDLPVIELVHEDSKEPKLNKQPFLNRAKASSLSSFSSGKASITLPNRRGSPDITLNTSPNTHSPVVHTTSLSSPIPYRDLDSMSSPRDSNENVKYSLESSVPMVRSKSDVTYDSNILHPSSEPEERPPPVPLISSQTDMDLIAGIIANATAAASSKTGSYSSLSSGKASLAPRLTPSASASTQNCSSANVTEKRAFRDLFGGRPKMTHTATAPAQVPIKEVKAEPSSTSFFSKSLFGRRKDEPSDPNQLELVEAGVEVKELKSTLGTMVVPHEISNPLPKVTLEMPKHAHRLG